MTSGHEHERLGAFLDGELEPAERAAVAAHLESCAECAERLRLWTAADDLVASSSADAPPGYFEAFPGRVRARLEPKRRPRLPAWTWAVAAALLVAVVTPLTWRERREPSLREASGPAAEPQPQPLAPAAPPAAAPPSQPGTLAAPPATPPAGTRPRAGGDAAGANRTDAIGAGATGRLDDGRASGDAETRAQRQKREGFAAPPSAATAAAPAPAPAPQARDEETPREADARAAGAELLSAERAREAEPGGPPEPSAAPQAEAPKAAEAKAARELSGAAASDAGLERGRVMRPPPKGAAGPHVVVEEEWHRLESARPATAAEWRELREAWRRFAARETEGAIAEAARLRLVETARAAYGASGDAADLAVFRADAQAYLARERAPQKDRVRRLLEELGAR